MAAEVRVPALLSPLTRGLEVVHADGTSIAAVLLDLDESFPGLAERLLDDSGLRRHVNVYLNGEDVRYRDGLRTPVADGDSIVILPAAARPPG